MLIPLILIASTLTAGHGGNGAFGSIQDAINAASHGDVILISPGLYVEDLVIDKSLTLAATDPGSVVIMPTTSAPGGPAPNLDLGASSTNCLVRANDVTLYGLVFDGNNPGFPLRADGRNGVVTDYRYGSFDGLEVTRCEIKNYFYTGLAIVGGVNHAVAQTSALDIYGNLSGLANGFAFSDSQVELTDISTTRCATGVRANNGAQVNCSESTFMLSMIGFACKENGADLIWANNRFARCGEGARLEVLHADVTISESEFLYCETGITFLGSNGRGYFEDNTFNGLGRANTVGIYTNTEVDPSYHNYVRGHVSRSNFTNLDWGVVCEEMPGMQGWAIDFQIGGQTDADCNDFVANNLGGIQLIHCDDNLTASRNYWALASNNAIEGQILHRSDDSSLGLVNFTPAVLAPDLGGTNLVADDFAMFTVTGCVANSPIAFAASFQGSAPLLTRYGIVQLEMPIIRMPTITSDGFGAATNSLWLPLGLTGSKVYVQAYDFTSELLSTLLVGDIL
ncbi:MAG: hypothetical protein HN405_08405 [Planctomycetes bacterium]|jgi:hypothetical protein|nr:hypothetical protein [Planctomycetota bacterium]MBT4029651.1 hypothetical protein [Planctomycetota bacterium]MBT4561151.1 hypothetical protein [Planctomycetota bacterium]MBT5101097.1 hypothetical protein [Planctomycetota bacterium]MBT7319515.1 hypothetical protein [Planctomycetota bacterium]